MVTVGSLTVTLVAAGYLIGRKELPHVARISGRYVGRSIGAILRAKNEYFEATKNSDLVKMQAELQKGLDELNSIRMEMTTISNMKRPYRPVSTPADRPNPMNNTPGRAVAASDIASSSSATPAAMPMATTTAYVPSAPRAAASAPTSTLALDEVDTFSQETYEELVNSSENPEQARLALAEVNMAKEKKFASRIGTLFECTSRG